MQTALELEFFYGMLLQLTPKKDYSFLIKQRKKTKFDKF